MKRLGKVILIVLAACVVVALGLWVSMQFTPRPAALAVRWVFDQGAAAASAALVKHVPAANPLIEKFHGFAGDDADFAAVFFGAAALTSATTRSLSSSRGVTIRHLRPGFESDRR